MCGSPYRGVVYRKKSKLCFSLVMYGIGSSNALYPASLSCRMFIIISLFRIKPQSGVVYKSAVFKKHLTVLLSFLKLEK